VNEAIELLKERSGDHFDPVLVRMFIENMDRVVETKIDYIDG